MANDEKNMGIFAEYLASIEDPAHRIRMEAVLNWVFEKYPGLVPRIGWNQPMFSDHGTFIIGFSVYKNHMAVSPEVVAIDHFSDEIRQAGYDHTKGMLRIKWDLPVDFALLARIIEFNLRDKADCTSFWRK